MVGVGINDVDDVDDIDDVGQWAARNKHETITTVTRCSV